MSDGQCYAHRKNYNIFSFFVGKSKNALNVVRHSGITIYHVCWQLCAERKSVNAVCTFVMRCNTKAS